MLSDPPAAFPGTTPHPNCFPAAPRQRGASQRAVYPARHVCRLPEQHPVTYTLGKEGYKCVQGQLAGHTQVLRRRNSVSRRSKAAETTEPWLPWS